MALQMGLQTNLKIGAYFHGENRTSSKLMKIEHCSTLILIVGSVTWVTKRGATIVSTPIYCTVIHCIWGGPVNLLVYRCGMHLLHHQCKHSLWKCLLSFSSSNCLHVT